MIYSISLDYTSFNIHDDFATLVVMHCGTQQWLLVLNREVAKYITCDGNADRRQINLFVSGGLQMWWLVVLRVEITYVNAY